MNMPWSAIHERTGPDQTIITHIAAQQRHIPGEYHERIGDDACLTCRSRRTPARKITCPNGSRAHSARRRRQNFAAMTNEGSHGRGTILAAAASAVNGGLAVPKGFRNQSGQQTAEVEMPFVTRRRHHAASGLKSAVPVNNPSGRHPSKPFRRLAAPARYLHVTGWISRRGEQRGPWISCRQSDLSIKWLDSRVPFASMGRVGNRDHPDCYGGARMLTCCCIM